MKCLNCKCNALFFQERFIVGSRSTQRWTGDQSGNTFETRCFRCTFPCQFSTSASVLDRSDSRKFSMYTRTLSAALVKPIIIVWLLLISTFIDVFRIYSSLGAPFIELLFSFDLLIFPLFPTYIVTALTHAGGYDVCSLKDSCSLLTNKALLTVHLQILRSVKRHFLSF